MIKITAADSWFSKCVRERANWKCEVCKTQYPQNAKGLHCSHFFGRRAYGVRFDPNNAFAHCFGCHRHMGSNPDDFREWVENKIGMENIQLLRERRDDILLAKTMKKSVSEIAKHYRLEWETMMSKRAAGEIGKIEFEIYNVESCHE